MVSNALLRLQGDPAVVAKEGVEVLKALYGQIIDAFPESPSENPSEESLKDPPVSYYITLIEISKDFKSRLTLEYVKDPQWNKVLEIIKRAIKEATLD